MRCDRPACPECLREASVGYQCVDCVNEAARSAPRTVTAVGRPAGQRLVAVPVLIALNVAVFVLTVVQARSAVNNAASPVFRAWAMEPGAVADGELWRLVTTGFLHYGPIHLLLNMIGLWVIGRDLETVLGRARFLLVYVFGLLGGSAAGLVANEPSIDLDINPGLAGASGAVFGLMGALGVVLRRMNMPLGPLIGLIAINVAISFLPALSLAAHLGGLAGGAAAAAALVYAPARGPNRTRWLVSTVGGLGVLVLVVIVIRIVSLS